MNDLIERTEILMAELYYLSGDARDRDTSESFKALARLVELFIERMRVEYRRFN